MERGKKFRALANFEYINKNNLKFIKELHPIKKNRAKGPILWTEFLSLLEKAETCVLVMLKEPINLLTGKDS